jgi:hypothetical protein
MKCTKLDHVHFKTHDLGLARGRWILASPLLDVRPIQTGRFHPYEDVRLGNFGLRCISNVPVATETIVRACELKEM